MIPLVDNSYKFEENAMDLENRGQKRNHSSSDQPKSLKRPRVEQIEEYKPHILTLSNLPEVFLNKIFDLLSESDLSKFSLISKYFLNMSKSYRIYNLTSNFQANFEFLKESTPSNHSLNTPNGIECLKEITPIKVFESTIRVCLLTNKTFLLFAADLAKHADLCLIAQDNGSIEKNLISQAKKHAPSMQVKFLNLDFLDFFKLNVFTKILSSQNAEITLLDLSNIHSKNNYGECQDKNDLFYSLSLFNLVKKINTPTIYEEMSEDKINNLKVVKLSEYLEKFVNKTLNLGSICSMKRAEILKSVKTQIQKRIMHSGTKNENLIFNKLKPINQKLLNMLFKKVIDCYIDEIQTLSSECFQYSTETNKHSIKLLGIIKLLIQQNHIMNINFKLISDSISKTIELIINNKSNDFTQSNIEILIYTQDLITTYFSEKIEYNNEESEIKPVISNGFNNNLTLSNEIVSLLTACVLERNETDKHSLHILERVKLIQSQGDRDTILESISEEIFMVIKAFGNPQPSTLIEKNKKILLETYNLITSNNVNLQVFNQKKICGQCNDKLNLIPLFLQQHQFQNPSKSVEQPSHAEKTLEKAPMILDAMPQFAPMDVDEQFKNNMFASEDVEMSDDAKMIDAIGGNNQSIGVLINSLKSCIVSCTKSNSADAVLHEIGFLLSIQERIGYDNFVIIETAIEAAINFISQYDRNNQFVQYNIDKLNDAKEIISAMID